MRSAPPNLWLALDTDRDRREEPDDPACEGRSRSWRQGVWRRRPRPFTPCTRYINRMVRLPDGSPVLLAPHQRANLDHVFTPQEGWLRYVTVLWEEIKKSGKTALAAWIASWVLNT